MQKIALITLFCFLSLFALSSAASDDSVFEPQNVTVQDLVVYNSWRHTHGRTYTSEDERIFRQMIFLENTQRVNSHNLSNRGYTQSLNQFSDLTDEEFRYRVLNSKVSQSRPKARGRRVLQGSSSNDEFMYESIDWRNFGAVNPVKDQGRCGSCWTFSAAGTIESYNFIRNGQLSKFSEQQLVDCVNGQNGYESQGCDGGWPEEALQYAIGNGIVRQSSYPYVGVQGKCRNIKPNVARYYPEGNYYHVNQTSEDLMRAISISPVSVCVNATPWQFYSGGVFSGCGETTMDDLNHAVIAVGYDSEGNWIIRNSWNTSWGEQGYMRLAAGNTCGVLLDNLALEI